MEKRNFFNELEKWICELANDHLVTPFNLLNNAKLTHYNYVKYYMDGDFFVSEMEFVINEKNHIFYYYFDMNNKLQGIYEEVSGIKVLRFSRKKELEKSIQAYNSISQEKIG